MATVQYSSAYNFNNGAVTARTDTSFSYKRVNDDIWRSARVDITDLIAGHLYSITINVDKTNNDLNLLVIGTTEDSSTGKDFGRGHFSSSTSYTIEVTPTGNKLTLDFMQGGIKSNFVTFTFSNFEIVDLTMSELRENLNLIKTELNNAKQMVNNIMNHVELPYIPLEYIESTGTQWIDTGIIPNQDTEFKADFVMNSPVEQSKNVGYLFSARTDYQHNRFQLSSYRTTSGGEFGYSNTNNYNPELTVGERCTITLKNKIFTSAKGTTTTIVSQTFTSPVNMTLFCCNDNGTKQEFGKLKLYSFKLYNNRLVRDFIPVKRKSDNVICLYDKVTKTFFENQGTGEFIAGGEV